MATNIRDRQKRDARARRRLRGICTMRIMGTGMATRRRSVITSQVPIVIRLT